MKERVGAEVVVETVVLNKPKLLYVYTVSPPAILISGLLLIGFCALFVPGAIM